MTDFERARKTMVDNQIRTIGVIDRRLLAALSQVPREEFVPELRRDLAYIDDGVPVSATRRLGSPGTFARLVQLASVSSTDHVLDVGAATGYSTAVLAKIAHSVVAVERDAELAALARKNLADLGAANATVVEGSLETAGKTKGPYDVIIVEGVLYDDPEALLAQLRNEGRLVALIQRGNGPAVAHLYVKSGKGVSATTGFDGTLPAIEPRQNNAFVF